MHRTTARGCGTALVFALFAPLAWNSGISLYGSSAIGSTVVLEIRGAVGQPAQLFIASGFLDPPLALPGPYGGNLQLDLASFWFTLPLPPLPPGGKLSLPLAIPNDPLLLSFIVNFQAFAPSLSNAVALQIHAPDDVLVAGQPNDRLGSNFAAGDFDHDGFTDVAATALNAGGNAGVVRLFHNAGGSLSHQATLLDPTPQTTGEFGSVLLAADLVGDAADDLLIAAPFAGATSADSSGEVFLFDGASHAITHHFTHPSGKLGTGFGTAISVGDYDLDGALDLAIGAPGTSLNGLPLVGEVHILRGPSFAPTLTLRAPLPFKANGLFGAMLTSADHDLDGSTDLLVGAPSAPQGAIVGAGEAFLFHGPFSSPPTKYLDPQPTPGSAFACRTVLADVTGGPALDVILGTPGGFGSAAGNPSGILQVGELQIFVDGVPSNVRHFDDPTPEFFQHYAMDVQVGDVNGDGFRDLLVGAFLADIDGATDAGELFVYLGPSLNQVLEWSAEFPAGGQQFGVFFVPVDLDNDGRDEVVIGAPYESPGGANFAGALHVVHIP